jgi:hypothetical protein
VQRDAFDDIYGGGPLTTGVQKRGTLDLTDGDTVEFRLTDDGSRFTFAVTEVGDPSSARELTGMSGAPLPASSLVALYNRESPVPSTNFRSALDDLSIAVVPEPSAATVLAVAALLLARAPRRPRVPQKRFNASFDFPASST